VAVEVGFWWAVEWPGAWFARPARPPIEIQIEAAEPVVRAATGPPPCGRQCEPAPDVTRMLWLLRAGPQLNRFN